MGYGVAGGGSAKVKVRDSSDCFAKATDTPHSRTSYLLRMPVPGCSRGLHRSTQPSKIRSIKRNNQIHYLVWWALSVIFFSG